jgi:perosamine synthetase
MIPVCEPNITEAEVANATDAVRSGWVSSQGAYLRDFEDAFASFHGVKHAVALSSGTAALEVALHGIGLQPGDEVIMPSFTIISVAVAVIRLGGVPRFVDVDERTWNIDPTQVQRAINEKTRAIIVVHSFGHPAEMDKLLHIAKSRNLRVIEDAAEAIASRYKGRLCGTIGDVGTFSLYGNKLITTGEGGIIITNSDEIAERSRRYINLYFGTDERFAHSELGYNFRMTNVQSAIGLAQLNRIDELVDKKLQVGKWYAEELNDSRTVSFQETVGDVKHVYWMYCVTLKSGNRHTAFSAMDALKAKGIGTRPFFKGLHLQKPLQAYRCEADCPFGVTESLYERGFYVPSSTELTREQVARVAECLEGLT